MGVKRTPPIQVKVSDADSTGRRKSKSREDSPKLEQLKAKRNKGKGKGSLDPAASAIGGSSVLPSKNLSTPPAMNPLTTSVSRGNTAYERSVNGSRITMHSNLAPTETQDVSWSEIDTLDDVKKMAKEPIVNDGFPLDFENDLTQMRRSHAQLLRLMRERNQRLKYTKLDSPPRNDQHGTTAYKTQGPEEVFNDPEIALDGEKYVSQLVDTIKDLHRC